MSVSSVKRPGEKTIVKECSSEAEYYSELKAHINEFGKKDGITAVICRNAYSLEKISASLKGLDIKIISEQDALPSSGAVLMELSLAKGLEFDNVILADVDQESYPDKELGRHCLYTAMSRATQRLVVLSCGKLSDTLKKF
jgi:DNA helicase-2/ATP-dependent DNA helicase PcrA